MSRICLPEEDGGIEQIISNGNLTFVRTHHGIFYCYDSRSVYKKGGDSLLRSHNEFTHCSYKLI